MLREPRRVIHCSLYTISMISILFFHSGTSILFFHSILPFWDFHSINARIITHMRKFITRTQCARHNEYVHKHDEYDVCIYICDVRIYLLLTYYLRILTLSRDHVIHMNNHVNVSATTCSTGRWLCDSYCTHAHCMTFTRVPA